MDNIKLKIASIPAIYVPLKKIKDFFVGIYIVNILFRCQNNGKKKNNKIKVAFIILEPALWNKAKSLFDRMRQDDRFDPIIIALPFSFLNGSLNHEKNETYQYLIEHGYLEAINALTDADTWVKIDLLNLDYVFYLQPYNGYMPKEYQSQTVARFAKICFINYGVNLTSSFPKHCWNQSFCGLVSIFFGENEDAVNLWKKIYWLPQLFHVQKIVCAGATSMATMLNKKDEKSKNWKGVDNKYRIIWTPRWSTDPTIGGSNFFKYKDFLLKFAEEHSEIFLLIRPHPMMFQNFLNTGELSKNDYDLFINRVNDCQNAAFDTEKEYEATFWGTDLLITDFSSIIAEYAVTGKPFIYCVPTIEFEYFNWTKRILECSYSVEIEHELEKVLLKLMRGNDEKKTARARETEELVKKLGKPVDKIVDAIVDDYNNR